MVKTGYSVQQGKYPSTELLARATKPKDHIKRLENCIRLGFDHGYVMSSSPDEKKTTELDEKKVLPYMKSAYSAGRK